MFEAFCLWLGLLCEVKDVPPPTLVGVIIAAPLATPKGGAPSIIAGPLVRVSAFDSECPIQPPAWLRGHLVSASRRHPGVSECELAKVAWCESNFDVHARSAAGAIGLFQFLPATAEELGVNPRNPRSASFGAARYLTWTKGRWHPDRYGRTRVDVNELGWATYNYGAGNMYKSQRLHGWGRAAEARPHLPHETQGYIKCVGSGSREG